MRVQTRENVKFVFEKISNVRISGIDHSDYPDYCDAYVESADYDGVEMTADQLDLLSEEREFVYEKIREQLY